MKFYAWVKFRGAPPEEWRCDHFEDFWYKLREFMLRHRTEIEWIIIN